MNNNISFILLAAVATGLALAMIDTLREDYWPFFIIIGIAAVALYALWKFQASFSTSEKNGKPRLSVFRKTKKRQSKHK